MAAADRNEKHMKRAHGTVCLITDYKSSYYMDQYAREKAKKEMVWRLAFDTQDD